MKPPTGPFWAWTDIGTGLQWYLAIIRGTAKDPMICYVQEDFEDYWYDDDWDEEEIKTIRRPPAL